MCLAVPGRLVERHDDLGTPMGTVDFGGVRKEVCLAYVPEIEVGEYALVHVGFAISRVDEESARATLALFEDIAALDGAGVDLLDDGDVLPALSADRDRGSEAP